MKTTVNSSYEEDTLSVKVKDTGIGMGENTTQRIFQPFERAAPDLDSEGFGLGLSIVTAIMKLHSHQCGVYNTDTGVCFWFEADAPHNNTAES